jgi:predicted ATPase/class 3 adenylate cyclase
MPNLPSGTVTFLFTDIEGSTALWERDRAAMREAVARQLAILQSLITAHHGVLFKTIGDGTQAAFASAEEALRAAVASQRALLVEDWADPPGPLRVRMALHAGEAIPDARGDYLAAPLNRLSRLLSTGFGGQILLSQAVQQLTRGALPAGTELRDLGEYRLRDLLEPERVYQLVHPDFPTEFPPLTSLENRPNNLPRQPTPFLGREREVGEVVDLLRRDDVQLLTLTGPGGTGKTRLALQAAAELVDDFPDGVFFVALASLPDPTQVPAAIAMAVGVRDEGGQPLPERLAAVLARKQVLLLIDNWEHLLEATPLLSELLRAAPGLTVLATSRAPLHLQAEREYPVPPLALPRRQSPPSPEQLAQYDAVRLFIERTHAIKPDFTVDDTNAPAVAEICHRLDGLPLAIELAAARLRLLPPQALLDRLEQRLPVLTGGARDAPARQQTLRATIAWSHELLTGEEQTLFRRLAVFAGGFSFEAAEAVANAERDVDVWAGLTALVDHSLVQQTESAAGEPRFTMLETIREFGLEQLAARSEADVSRARHAAYFSALLDRPTVMMLPHLPNTRQVLERLILEYPNLRAAMDWHRTTGDVSRVLEIAGTLYFFWQLGGQLVDGRMWLEWGLRQEGSTPDARAAGQLGLAGVFYAQSDGERALMLCQACLEHYKATGDAFGAAFASYVAAHSALFLGDLTLAMGYLEDASTRFSQLPGIPGQVALLNHLPMLRGWAALLRGDVDDAAAIMQATAVRQRSTAQDIGSPEPYFAWTLQNLGYVRRAQGDLLAALAHHQAALVQSWRFREIRCCVRALMGAAGVLTAWGQVTDAARLYGAAEAFCQQTGVIFGDVWDLERALGLPEPWQQADTPLRTEAELLRAVVRSRGGGVLPPLEAPELAAQAWAVGKTLPFEAAMAEALALDPARLADDVAEPSTAPGSTASMTESPASPPG